MVCVLKIKYYKQTKNNSLPAEKPRTNVARRHNSGPLHVNSINYIAVFFCCISLIRYTACAFCH